MSATHRRCGAGLVSAFARGDQPVRSIGVQIVIAVVAGVCQHSSDEVIGVPGSGVDACRCFLFSAHHRGEARLVVGGLLHLDRDDQLVAGDGELRVVALQKPSPSRHDSRLRIGGVRHDPGQLLGRC